MQNYSLRRYELYSSDSNKTYIVNTHHNTCEILQAHHDGHGHVLLWSVCTCHMWCRRMCCYKKLYAPMKSIYISSAIVLVVCFSSIVYTLLTNLTIFSNVLVILIQGWSTLAYKFFNTHHVSSLSWVLLFFCLLFVSNY